MTTQVPFLCLSFTTYNIEMRDLPGYPEVKNLRLSAGDGGSIPDRGTKIPHATVQLSPHTTTAAKSLQSCPTLCDPIDGGPPGSPVPGILQARTLEWVSISFSNAWKGKVKVKSLSRVRLFSTPWSAAYQAPPSMGFSRQEYWTGSPVSSPEIIKNNV